MEAMPPKYLIDKRDLIVIRPLAYCKEEEIQNYSDLVKHPIIPCNLCGSQTNLQRKKIKALIKQWELIYPNRKAIMFRALQNVSPSHLLDRNIFNFEDLQPLEDSSLFV